MPTGCVVLCSERLPNPDAADIATLVNLLQPVTNPFDGFYAVRDYGARGVDGGNGGGGDGNPKPPVFIRGYDHVGLWNFRYCRPYESKSAKSTYDRDKSFPVAARIEVCIPFDSIDAAVTNIHATTGTYAVLHRIFENVLVVPFSTPK